MLAYGSKAQREQIISGFYGQVRRLVKHRIAAPVIAVTYVDFATAEQRAKMEQEFYGPQFEVFKVAGKGTALLTRGPLYCALRKPFGVCIYPDAASSAFVNNPLN